LLNLYISITIVWGANNLSAKKFYLNFALAVRDFLWSSKVSGSKRERAPPALLKKTYVLV